MLKCFISGTFPLDEQLFQPYTYVGATLYLHFHVLNPISIEYQKRDAFLAAV